MARPPFSFRALNSAFWKLATFARLLYVAGLRFRSPDEQEHGHAKSGSVVGGNGADGGVGRLGAGKK
jgi:hypothetical protein